MSPIAAYAIARADGRLTPRPVQHRDRRNVSSSGLGLGGRIRRLFNGGPRVASEPGFAAFSDDAWSDSVPKISGYPSSR